MGRENMKIALTGGIACGKSLLARFLNELGVETIDADDIVHELIPDPAERRRIAAEVFADPAKRRELEARLHPQIKARIDEFLDIANRQSLSMFFNTETQRHRDTEIEKAGVATPDPAPQAHSKNLCAFVPPCLCVKSPQPINTQLLTANDQQLTTNLRLAIIPLLFETHWDAEYDIICTVASTRDIQISRMVRQRGYTREEAEARLAAQLPVEEKAAKSQYVINNNGTTEELKAEAKRFVEWLTAKYVFNTETQRPGDTEFDKVGVSTPVPNNLCASAPPCLCDKTIADN